MTRRIGQWAARAVIITAGLSLAAPGLTAAQGGDGFLFKQPNVTLKFETGYAIQRANSDVYDFLLDQHTLDRRDFDSPYVGGELAVRASERWDVALSIGWQRSTARSEFVDWVDGDDQPIEQTTQLQLVPVVVSGKFYPLERGVNVGRFAWIPRTFAPFVGGGLGFVSYRLSQRGDFVDFETFEVFPDRLTSEHEALMARALAGVNVSLAKQFLLTVEARYSWASAELGRSYSAEFDNIDLSGVQFVGGIAVRF